MIRSRDKPTQLNNVKYLISGVIMAAESQIGAAARAALKSSQEQCWQELCVMAAVELTAAKQVYLKEINLTVADAEVISGDTRELYAYGEEIAAETQEWVAVYETYPLEKGLRGEEVYSACDSVKVEIMGELTLQNA